MVSQTVAVVTGANKGIGLAIIRNLALRYPSSTFNKGPCLIYLTSRNQQRGLDAIDSFQKDSQLGSAKALIQHGGLTDIKYQNLDITQKKSIQELSGFLKEEHPNGIDIVVNNAGIALDGFNVETAQKTMDCNYYGTLGTCQSLLPLLRPSGRIVNMASIMGSLSRYPSNLRERFTSLQSLDQVTNLMEEYLSSIHDGSYAEKGWPPSPYMVSKAGVIGMTRVLARMEQEEGGQKRLINACCPGYVDTDMSRHRGHKSVDEGATTPVHLALDDLHGRTGEFWQDSKVISW